MAGHCFVGCAGWSLPRDAQQRFAAGASHLERYATRLGATEINSSFHRPHAPFVWRRWAEAVPAGFRFSVKLPKAITHERRLLDAGPLLDEFLEQASLLGDRLGCLLVQMPPSLAFAGPATTAFLRALRERWQGAVAAEPRHESWFYPEADALLAEHRVARVLADPLRHPAGASPGGWRGMTYVRLHGSPRVYYSAYEPALIERLAERLRQDLAGRDAWCIFDNTASGAAVDNALALQDALSEKP